MKKKGNAFGEALNEAQTSIGMSIKRAVWKNDTIVFVYKKQLVQASQSNLIRFPYQPTQKDLFAKDWQVVEVPLKDEYGVQILDAQKCKDCEFNVDRTPRECIECDNFNNFKQKVK